MEEKRVNKINWFPGHMKKALDQMRAELNKADVIIYVLDSRAPKSCLNPELKKLAGTKPVLYILNKIDLTDLERLNKVKACFKGENHDYLMLNSTQSGLAKNVCEKMRLLCKNKVEKFKNKGISVTLRAIVVGVPNSGKSTLVNNLCKKAKAVTGDRPGVTKNKQWFKIASDIEVCDTPGTLYPNLGNQEVAKSLAFIGSIRDEVVDEVELAEEFLKRMQKLYPGKIEERYKGASNLQEICKARAFLLPGGEFDVSRGAKALISDFRSGRLGDLMIGD